MEYEYGQVYQKMGREKNGSRGLGGLKADEKDGAGHGTLLLKCNHQGRGRPGES